MKAVSGNGALSSGVLADLAGVSRDTLRHYERKGVLPRPLRGRGIGDRLWRFTGAHPNRILGHDNPLAPYSEKFFGRNGNE